MIMVKKKVAGIGGIFFKCNDPEEMKDWYSKNLGLVKDEYGSVFEFRKSDEPKQKVYSVWSPFPKDTDYFKPSKKKFMVNYRVENIEELLADLKAKGVKIIDNIETFEYGKSVHIIPIKFQNDL